ncbi:mucin-3A [Saccopteryx bilineata]|uniref:mucin-3A n=1 Tax=Saccopteryx bilineata TaxID=59482 RepID=UPI0033903E8B
MDARGIPGDHRTLETSVSTAQTPTTSTSARTTLTTTQTTTPPKMTTTPGSCDNNGTWIQGHCLCPPGFSGDRCELLEVKCQNGGQWNGLSCECPSTFSGSRCENGANELELETVAAEVGMQVAVEQKFSPDLNDKTSKAFKDFNNSFQNQMREVCQNMPEFKSVEILFLRNGSIVVDYLVLLELPFSVQLDNKYETVKTVLKEKLQNASQDQNQNSCQNNQTLCFKSDSIKVNNTKTDLTPKAICRRSAAPGYEDFYFPLVEKNRLRCVTNCTSGVKGYIDCNQGQCLLEKSGPTCRCFSTDTHWFSGPRCERSVAWKALVGGLAGAAALLLLLVALSVFLVRSRRRPGHGGGRSWDDADEKWFDICDENTVGTFTNVGFEDSGSIKEKNFHVALETVDTNMRVHTQRPEVASSWL